MGDFRVPVSQVDVIVLVVVNGEMGLDRCHPWLSNTGLVPKIDLELRRVYVLRGSHPPHRRNFQTR